MALVRKEAGAPKTRIAILVFDGTQLIDFTAPYEVFAGTPFEVFTVGATAKPALIGGGLTIAPTYTFANSPQADVVIVPGGRIPIESAETAAWLRAQASGAQIVMSICNGAFLLAKAGLLDGLSATTTYSHLNELAQAVPNLKVVRDRRFVDNGKIVTTGGLSAGMDGSLHLVERLLGATMARKIALDLEYHWQPESPWTRPALADRFVPRIDLSGLPDFTPVSSDGDADGWRMEFSTTAAPTQELLNQIARKLVAATHWTPRTNEGPPAERRFHFEDESRRRWEASLILRPAEGDAGATLRFVLRRAS
jgi:putative intracellular protease/amidase